MASGDRPDRHTHPQHHGTTGDAVPDPDADTLAYPISPDYVKSWTFICVCQAELLVNLQKEAQACKARPGKS